MDTKDLKGLIEAYSEVYAPEQLDEAFKDLPADKMRGQVIKHAASGTKRAFLSKFRGQKGTTAGNVEDAKATKSLNKAKKIQGEIEKREKMGSDFYQGSREGRAIANKRRGRQQNEELDIFDVVLEFLQAEGFAETLEEAEWLMANQLDSEDIANILDEALTGERYKKVMKKPGGMAYSRKVSADPAKRATRGGRGGESDFGSGDRGSGNKAARRAGKSVDDSRHED